MCKRIISLAIAVVSAEGDSKKFEANFARVTGTAFTDGVRTGESLHGGIRVSTKELRGNTIFSLLRGIGAALDAEALPKTKFRKALHLVIDTVLLADIVCTSHANGEQVKWLGGQIEALADPAFVALLGPFDHVKKGVGRFFRFPKFHLFQEIPRQIRLWGSLQNVSMVRAPPPPLSCLWYPPPPPNATPNRTVCTRHRPLPPPPYRATPPHRAHPPPPPTPPPSFLGFTAGALPYRACLS
jgi:hypothetical protein